MKEEGRVVVFKTRIHSLTTCCHDVMLSVYCDCFDARCMSDLYRDRSCKVGAGVQTILSGVLYFWTLEQELRESRRRAASGRARAFHTIPPPEIYTPKYRDILVKSALKRTLCGSQPNT